MAQWQGLSASPDTVHGLLHSFTQQTFPEPSRRWCLQPGHGPGCVHSLAGRQHRKSDLPALCPVLGCALGAGKANRCHSCHYGSFPCPGQTALIECSPTFPEDQCCPLPWGESFPGWWFCPAGETALGCILPTQLGLPPEAQSFMPRLCALCPAGCGSTPGRHATQSNPHGRACQAVCPCCPLAG